jgi:hypothetical protein
MKGWPNLKYCLGTSNCLNDSSCEKDCQEFKKFKWSNSIKK